MNEWMFILAPSAPPQALTTVNITSTSIELSWSPIPPEFINADQLVGYTVFWWKVNDSIFNMTSTEEPRVCLTGLEEFTEYYITVSAMNNVGIGPNSSLFTARTEEKGKKKVYVHARFLWCVTPSSRIDVAFEGRRIAWRATVKKCQ